MDTIPLSQDASSLPSLNIETVEEIRTLFVSGLPADVKEREVHNLFRVYPGYQGCSLKEGKQPAAFVVYSDRTSALVARDTLDGLQMDPQVLGNLRVLFANTNSRITNLNQSDATLSTKIASVYNSSFFVSTKGPPGFSVPPPRAVCSAPTSPGRRSRANSRHNSIPCSTLYVRNLARETQEADLIPLFGLMPGYKRIRVVQKEDQALAWVEFSDIQCSTSSMKRLQGFPVNKQPLHIAFAKSKMGEGNRSRRNSATPAPVINILGQKAKHDARTDNASTELKIPLLRPERAPEPTRDITEIIIKSDGPKLQNN